MLKPYKYSSSRTLQKTRTSTQLNRILSLSLLLSLPLTLDPYLTNSINLIYESIAYTFNTFKLKTEFTSETVKRKKKHTESFLPKCR